MIATMTGDPLTQQQALDATPLAGRDRARFFRAERQQGLECLTATFRTHVYAPHTHETFVVGTIMAGCEAFSQNGIQLYAGPGDVCVVPPEAVHDGRPHGAGYAYRMTYPAIGLLRDIAGDAGERTVTGVPDFAGAVIRDPALAAEIAAAHAAADAGVPALEADERLHRAFVRLLARHGRQGATRAALERPAPREGGPVARARAFLEANYAEPVDLAGLAAVAGIPRTRLIRAFARETGLTPHAWLTDRRIRAARGLLAAGLGPAAVAAACGFCDQSHLTRAFRARIGVAPGAFRGRAG